MSREVRSRPPDAVLTRGDQPGRSLAAGGVLVRGFRNFLGVVLPPGSVQLFGTRAQVSVEGTVNGHAFEGLAFPTADATHFLNLNARLRRRLALTEGDRIEFVVRRRQPADDDVVPAELARALESAPEAQIWWAHLASGHRRTALRFIGGARGPEVRAWRAADVLRRAKRYFEKEGPFYPTKADQPLLSRRSGQRASR